ncbi:MAG: hypothetical protein U5L96_18340 [Owenweeksia sp.]|nr:hypothetical protein [Owenweeksia sp.]
MFRATLVVIFLVGISTVAWSQPELQLAHQYYAQEEYEKALTYLEELEKRYSNRKIYELKLNCYLAMEDYKAAEKHIEQSIRKSQNVHYGSFADLTYVYRKQENPIKPRSCYRR